MSTIAFRRRGTGTGLAAAAALASLALTASVQAANANPQTFTAPIGNPGTADAVSSVVVSNDPTGSITFTVKFGAPLQSTDAISVYVDADANPATGDQQTAGAEYVLVADMTDNSVSLGAWNGSTWNAAPSSATLHGGHADTEQTFTVNRSELGNTSAFNFWADSCEGDCGAGHDYQVPEAGAWNYQLAASVRLTALALYAPKTAKAGADYMAAMVVQRSDTAGFLGNEGRVQCTAKVGGKQVAAVGTIVTITYQGAKVSAALCDVRVGRRSHGKPLTGTITATYAGGSASRSYAATVR
jgi:hypothetical protein